MANPSATLNPAQMRSAIKLLTARLDDLSKINFRGVGEPERPDVRALHARIEQTLVDIFGRETDEYRRWKISDLHAGGIWSDMSPADVAKGYVKGSQRAVATLNEIIAYFEERLMLDQDDDLGRIIQAYKNLDLHPEIARAASNLYSSGHYSNAIEDAVKALNALVRLRSGRDDLDGMPLMKTVFSAKNPVLQFNDLKTESDQNEQEGFMMMFAGAVAGLSNPRAHTLIKDDPERALEFIAYVSLLGKLLDGAKKAPPKTP